MDMDFQGIGTELLTYGDAVQPNKERDESILIVARTGARNVSAPPGVTVLAHRRLPGRFPPEL